MSPANSRASGRIAIIGAGLAGLAAARTLATSGREVRVFEKARGRGGRVSTRRAGDYAFDHGAQYFTCRDPRFEPIVESWQKAGVVAVWDGRIRTLCRGRSDELREPTDRYVGVPGMSALGRALAQDLELVFETRVQSVRDDAKGWQLSFEGGGAAGAFEQVIVATPAPQAAPLLEASPELAAAAAAVRMEPCWAGMFVFAHPLPIDLDAAFVSDSPLSWIARDASKPGRPAAEAWVVHATADWTRSHLDDTPERVAEQLRGGLADALGQMLPATEFQAAHRWLYALTEQALGQPFLYDASRGIGACGDWGDGGRIERAVLSGESLAKAMLSTAGAAH
jgi:predicted NAD/FAD-dependent oxidoreductase